MLMKMKKVFAGAVALTTVTALTLAFAGTNAAAPNSVGASVSNATAAAGQPFSVNVSLTGIPAPGIMAADFAVKYDPAVLTVTGVTEGAISDTGAAAQELIADPDLAGSTIGGSAYSCLDWYIAENQVRVIWATGLADSAYWIHTDGVLLTITGTVKATAAAGDSLLEIVPITRKVYPGSATDNTEIIFGYLDSTGTPAKYPVEKTAGKVSVTANPEQSTGTGTTGPDITGPTEEFTPRYGDVDLDGDVEIGDVVLLMRALVGRHNLSRKELINSATLPANNNFTNGGEPGAVNLLHIVKWIVTGHDPNAGVGLVGTFGEPMLVAAE